MGSERILEKECVVVRRIREWLHIISSTIEMTVTTLKALGSSADKKCFAQRQPHHVPSGPSCQCLSHLVSRPLTSNRQGTCGWLFFWELASAVGPVCLPAEQKVPWHLLCWAALEQRPTTILAGALQRPQARGLGLGSLISSDLS